MMNQIRSDFLSMFQAALDAVSGEHVVRQAFQQNDYPSHLHVIAIGKAADAMLQGVPSKSIKTALLITKKGYLSGKFDHDQRVRCIESDHPVPGEASLRAGQALVDFLETLPANEPCLFLISGGTSALVEVLRDDYSLTDLQALNDKLLGDNVAIDAINAKRRELSSIKGGGLWSFIGDREVACLLISDVQGDDPAVIGSGLLFPVPRGRAFHWEIIASLDQAKQAAAARARELGYRVEIVADFLRGSAQQAAKNCVVQMKKQTGTLFVWGGETTVKLPPKPGKGGRNQHLALAAAIEMAGEADCVLLAAGTDGSDGVSDAAGAVVDGDTVARGQQSGLDANACLQRADSNRFFRLTDELIVTGATGTNVMDLVIGIKNAAL